MEREEFETLLGDIEIDLPSAPRLMTREQFTEMLEWLKQTNPRGSQCNGTLHWMVNHGYTDIEDIKANITALVGLVSRCDDYHISRLRVDEWEASKYNDPNIHMDATEWNSYIENIICIDTDHQICKHGRGK